MYTRESFNRHRTNAVRIQTSLGKLTAGIAVVLGAGQLLFIRLVADRLAKDKALPFEVSLFLTYIVIVGFLLWRMNREVTKARPRCPKCKTPLTKQTDAVTTKTGKCTACGADYFAPTEMKPAR